MLWSQEDINFLQDNYPALDTEKIAIKLNRTNSSVQGKVHRLGLIKGSRWTEEEINCIKLYYNEKGKTKLLSILNKTWTSIIAKAIALGVSFGKLPIKQRFMNHIDKKSDQECWNWLGAKNIQGYGTIGVDGKILSAHRLSYELFVGSAHLGIIYHSCGNKVCVNPKHLSLHLKANYADIFR